MCTHKVYTYMCVRVCDFKVTGESSSSSKRDQFPVTFFTPISLRYKRVSPTVSKHTTQPSNRNGCRKPQRFVCSARMVMSLRSIPRSIHQWCLVYSSSSRSFMVRVRHQRPVSAALTSSNVADTIMMIFRGESTFFVEGVRV